MYASVLTLYVIHSTILRVAITTTSYNQAYFLGMQDWLSYFDWAVDFDSIDVSSSYVIVELLADRFTEALHKFAPISKPHKCKSII